MSTSSSETLQRTLTALLRDAAPSLSAEEQTAAYSQLYQLLAELSAKNAPPAGSEAFPDLAGLTGGPPQALDSIQFPYLPLDFDEAVIPTQIRWTAELYYIYQHDRMGVFQVVDVLLKLFHEGRMRVQRGPGARALYLLEKRKPLRYTRVSREIAYRRAFNYGQAPLSEAAAANREFHRSFVAWISSIAQYWRDLLIGEVIRGGQLINQRPFASQATVQRLGADLRWAIDRTTYGNIVVLAMETLDYLNTILRLLESPDILKAFDANTKWDVIEIVSQRHLGGIRDITRRARLADAGRKLLQFLADNPMRTQDHTSFQAEISPFGQVAEEWLAAYKLTPEGSSFAGVHNTLQGSSRKRTRTPVAA
jgi:hypothetical protein